MDIRDRVKAVGINFPDVLIIEDKYQSRPPRPFAPGGEVSGIVTEIAEGVTEVKVGDRVLAQIGHGGLAEAILPPARRLTSAPARYGGVSSVAFVTVSVAARASDQLGDADFPAGTKPCCVCRCRGTKLGSRPLGVVSKCWGMSFTNRDTGFICVIPKMERRAAQVMARNSRARVMPTYARRRSSARASARLLSPRLLACGKMPSSLPII